MYFCCKLIRALFAHFLHTFTHFLVFRGFLGRRHAVNSDALSLKFREYYFLTKWKLFYKKSFLILLRAHKIKLHKKVQKTERRGQKALGLILLISLLLILAKIGFRIQNYMQIGPAVPEISRIQIFA